MARKLIVEIVGDTSALERGYRRADKATQKFGTAIEKQGRNMGKGVAAGAAGFFGTAGLIAGLKGSINAASDLNEQISKTDQVFGASSAEVKAWSETTATAFGISRREALATASSFGALFAPMGLVGDEAARQSQQLVELGADLASFYNTDVADALAAIRSGIVGESEPLRRYGVLLSESRVQAEALATTHKASARDLTAAEKALARITLIFRDTSKAQGDFARTSEGLANQSRSFRAELDDLKVSIGEVYGPGAQKVLGEANFALRAVLGTSQEQVATQRVQAALIPTIAREYGRLREQGVSASDAIERLTDDLGGTAKASMLVADAINYFAGGPVKARIEGLRAEIRGLGIDAETSAKMIYAAAQAAAATAAAVPVGLAAISPGARLGLRLAQAELTEGTADELAVLVEQRELNARKMRSLRYRLARASGKRAGELAEQLNQVLREDASALSAIQGIQRANAAAAQDIIDAQEKRDQEAREAAAKRAKRAKERRYAWLEFAIERAEATETVKDNLKAWRALERALKAQIRNEGRTLELVRKLWQTRERIRDLNKSKADVDPLAGLMQVSSKRLASILAAGTGLDLAGRARLVANIGGAEIQPLTIPVNIDGREVGRAVTRDQSAQRWRTARQTSGFRG